MRSPPSALLESAGWAAVHEHARSLAARLAELLAEHGRPAAPRAGPARSSPSPAPTRAAERELLAEHGVIVRNIPGRPWLRASIGAWNDEGDLERLIGVLSR